MKEFIQSFFKAATEGFVTAKTFIYGIFIFLDLDIDIIKILGILMAVDTVLGILKAIKFKKQVSFKVLMWGMVTKMSVLVVPMILALVAKSLSFDFSWFVNAVLNILILSEAFSAITNILSIKQNKEIENTDFIAKLIHAIRNGLGGLINKSLTEINPEDKTNKDGK